MPRSATARARGRASASVEPVSANADLHVGPVGWGDEPAAGDLARGPAHPTRIAVVGTGAVGSSFAFALLLSGLTSEIVLIDANERKAEGEAMDLMHAVPFARTARVWAGDVADCRGAAVTVITAGAAQRPGESRMDLVTKNAAIVRALVPSIAEANPDGIIVVATNPSTCSRTSRGASPGCRRSG